MDQNEVKYDKLLKIKTTGRDDSRSDQYCYPYEPTPYCVLERLAYCGYLGKKNHLIDYGCGKGRVDFFLAWQVRCRTTGVEYDERMIKAAEENKQRAVSGAKTTFILENAAFFQVPESADRFYFFNPFSVEILRSVIGRIRESWYEKTREMLLFFYYPSDEYISYLMTVDELEFLDEIDCQDLFDGKNPRERISDGRGVKQHDKTNRNRRRRNSGKRWNHDHQSGIYDGDPEADRDGHYLCSMFGAAV